MKILFTHSYFYAFDPKQWKARQPYPPLMTIQAAACVRAAGHEISLWDPALEQSVSGLHEKIRQYAPEWLVIYDDGFNYLTKMCLTRMREAALEMTKTAHQENIRIIICSSDSTDHSDLYLDAGADYILQGEGEETLVELLSSLQNPSGIKGLIFRENGKTVNTGKRTVMKDLDALPMPAWDLVDLQRYKNTWMGKHGFFSLNIATTRGCPYKCNWCAKPIYGNRYNARSPEHVITEIKYLVEKTGVEKLWVCDDIFGLKPGWVERFATLIQQENIAVKLKIQTRADLLTEPQAVENLVKAGLEEAWIGAESGSQKILDAMDKGTTIQQIYECTALLKKNKVKTGFFLQFGYPGEEPGDIALTLKMLDDLQPDDIGISISYPLPGTAFYENVKKEMKDKFNWEHSDDLSLMYHSTFSPAFYKTLHRYVHKRYRKKQSLRSLKNIFRKPDITRSFKWLYYLPMEWLYKIRLIQFRKIG